MNEVINLFNQYNHGGKRVYYSKNGRDLYIYTNNFAMSLWKIGEIDHRLHSLNMEIETVGVGKYGKLYFVIRSNYIYDS